MARYWWSDNVRVDRPDTPAYAFESINPQDVAIGPDGSIFAARTNGGVGNPSYISCTTKEGMRKWWLMVEFASYTTPAIAPDGSVYVAGSVSVDGSGYSPVSHLIKLSPDGAPVWQRTFTGSGGIGHVAVNQLSGDLVLLCGASISSISQCCVVLLDSNGDLKWQTALPSSGFSSVGRAAFDPSGNLFVAFSSNLNPESTSVNYVSKLSSMGALLWSRRSSTAPPSGSKYNYTTDIAVDSAGNVYVAGHYLAGYFRNFSTGKAFKYSADGQLQWYKQIADTTILSISTICIEPTSGDVLIAGSRGLYRYQSSGISRWAPMSRGFGPSGAVVASLNQSGDLVITGTSPALNRTITAVLPLDGPVPSNYGGLVYTDQGYTAAEVSDNYTEMAGALTSQAGTLILASISKTIHRYEEEI